MRILHLSDFHLKSSEKDLAAQNLLVEKLLSNLETEAPIDFLLFTGDLVFSGSKTTDFELAYNTFLKPIALKLNIGKENVLLCAGNHDVDRNQVSSPLKAYFRKFTKPEELTKIVEENKETEFGLSCKPTLNFLKFQQKFFDFSIRKRGDEVHELYSIHVRDFNGSKLGFVTINTAWCASGDDDKGNLFFPKTELEKAVNKLKQEKVDWRILLLHHPLTDLREFNKIDIEDFIYSEFHFMFSGHLHKREDFVKFMQNEGIFGTYAHAAFTKKQDGKIGYSIMDIDLETLEITLNKHIYDFEERVYLMPKPITLTFPTNETKQNQIKIFKTLRKRLGEVIENANELNIAAKNSSYKKNFTDLFVDPVLRRQPQVETPSAMMSTPRIKFKALYDAKNFLIYGKDKTGKTSLLFKLQIDLLRDFSHRGEIPVYINLSDYKENVQKFDLQKIISKFIEHTNAQTEVVLKSYKFRLLIDNFDPIKKDLISKISEFLIKYSNCTYVIVADQTLAQSYKELDLGINGFERMFIHDISRNEIRQLTKKWPSIPLEKRDQFIDKIAEILQQHSMPFNFWTLSIFLWIFAGKNTLNFNNNSELLELYIDDILDRTNLAADPQNRFSYSNYKLLLGEIAYELLVNYKETNHAMPYTTAVAFIDKFKNKNIRRVGKTSEIMQHLLERGILKKVEDDLISFRLNGVFEYFLAYSFVENKGFFNEVLTNDALYLSFKNEFEIYSGFARNEAENRDFLERIYLKTKNAFQDLSDRMQGELDTKLVTNLKDVPLDFVTPMTELVNANQIDPLSEEEKDSFLDEVNAAKVKNVEVRPKKMYDTSIKRFEILERYLIINGRVFKNIDNINDSVFVNEIFDFIVDASCDLGFLLIEELENGLAENVLEDIDKSIPKKLIFQLISNFLPNVVQTFIHDTIGHINFEGIVLAKIDSLKHKTSGSQFKLFLLYSLLLDIDLKKYKSKIDDLIDLAKLGIIKYSIVLKLYQFLLMKSYDDDDMILFLKERIRKINILINPKTDMKEFNQKFERTRKILILKRNNDHD